MRAWALATEGTHRHSGIAEPLGAIANQPPCFAAEMSRRPAKAPASSMHIARDFPLDIGVPDRSRRTGLFDADFSNFGSYMARRNAGMYVLYAYFAGGEISRTRGEWRNASAGSGANPRVASWPDLTSRADEGGPALDTANTEGTAIHAICDGVGCAPEILAPGRGGRY